MNKSLNIKTNITFVMFFIIVCLVFYKIYIIQFKEGSYWREKSKKITTKFIEVEASRGNIYDQNYNLLATSLPYYDIGIDVNVPGLDDKTFNQKKDSLALMLSKIFPQKSKKQYLAILNKARQEGDRYVLIQRKVSYQDLQKVKQFPILRNGKKGGLVVFQTSKRILPFRYLAARTIGMVRENIKPIGLEGAYDSILRGVSGKRLMQKIAENVWRPVNDDEEIQAKNGKDIVTTLDINIQDVAEHALLNALIKNQATYGSVILMETKTGKIKAIANLVKKDSVTYEESLNFAIGYPSEPGSTFKLASVLALLEEYDVSIDEKINVGNGECTYYNQTMRDAHPPHSSIITLEEAFKTSSNVGISKIVTKYFSKNPDRFVYHLSCFHLEKPYNIEIPGEGIPRIKHPKDKDWYGTTLPWMSIGYESLLTPLHILMLYNLVANNGTIVKPMFVERIEYNGKAIKTFTPQIIAENVLKPTTIQKAKQLLRSVVESGTAKGLNISTFKVAGKTGTAQIAKKGRYYTNQNDKTYLASFVGFFPLEDPLYTCIVTIHSPSKGIYYGGLVAGPVFKEIAEKVYSTNLQTIPPLNDKDNQIIHLPFLCGTTVTKLDYLSQKLHLPSLNTSTNNDSLIAPLFEDSLQYHRKPQSVLTLIQKNIMPDLKGMAISETLPILESKGLKIILKGNGWIVNQSIPPYSKIQNGQKLILTLNSKI
ncbi:MAG: penicillin-binding protein [Bacteroidia bacterium]|nr:MAG: penicillin-binding protein [Bacteroidia bacterium]